MAREQRTKMADVAAAAGVSMKTVSRVVNNERWVSTEVEDRVRAAIAELDYRPDYRAQTLRNLNTATRTIGCVHADIANPFFTALHSGIEEAMSEQGCLILTGSSGESVHRQENIVAAFSRRRVDGLIIVPAGDTAGHQDSTYELQAEIERGTPVVFVDREPHVGGDFVTSDHYGGAVAATRHLIEHGHRKIAFMSDDPVLYSAAERRRGYLDAMAEVGALPDARTGISRLTDAEHHVRSALAGDDAPTAFFAAQNQLTGGAIKALHGLGQQRSVAIVGFDDVAMADVIEPGVTTVPQDAKELGRQAGTRLLERIAAPSGQPTRTVLPVSLIKRGSGEIPGPHNKTST